MKKSTLYINALGSILMMLLSIQTHAVKPFVVTCGDGKTIDIADSRYSPSSASNLCLRAGHPAPKQLKPSHSLSGSPSMGHSAASGCPKYNPDSARLPTGNCKTPKDTIKYDPDCAKLYGCNDSAKPRQTPQGTLSSKTKKKKGLLLPAVQAATCGSDSSISAALDQCGTKGHKFAHCTKKSGNWTCTPNKNRSGPNIRLTKLNSNS